MPKPFQRVCADAALELLAQASVKPVVLFDIRDPASFAIGHHPNAIHLTRENLAAQVDGLEKTTPVLVYCYHGNSSQMVAHFFAEQGFHSVGSIDGGWEELEALLAARAGV